MAISDTPFDIRHASLTMRERAALAQAPRVKPQQQWWNVPAKIAAADAIAQQERQRAKAEAASAGDDNPHSDRFDAMRHARWSRRMAAEIDPFSARLFGAAHEINGSLLRGQPAAELLMDMRNNAEGRRAARDARPTDPTRLQTSLAGRGAADAYPSRR